MTREMKLGNRIVPATVVLTNVPAGYGIVRTDEGKDLHYKYETWFRSDAYGTDRTPQVGDSVLVTYGTNRPSPVVHMYSPDSTFEAQQIGNAPAAGAGGENERL